jgi:hypothetical protein
LEFSVAVPLLPLYLMCAASALSATNMGKWPWKKHTGRTLLWVVQFGILRITVYTHPPVYFGPNVKKYLFTAAVVIACLRLVESVIYLVARITMPALYSINYS